MRHAGNFVGHAIPALFFLGYGTFATILAFLRLRRGYFFQYGAVEQNLPLLRMQAIVVGIACIAGLAVECGSGAMAGLGCGFNALHETLYSAFLVASAGALLESGRFLPTDTHKWCSALALGVEHLLFITHADMFAEPEATMHRVLADIAVLGAFAAVASAAKSAFLPAHIAWVVLFIAQGLWLFYIGFIIYDPFVDPFHSSVRTTQLPTRQQVVIHACAGLLALTMAVLLMSAACMRAHVKASDIRQEEGAEQRACLVTKP